MWHVSLQSATCPNVAGSVPYSLLLTPATHLSLRNPTPQPPPFSPTHRSTKGTRADRNYTGHTFNFTKFLFFHNCIDSNISHPTLKTQLIGPIFLDLKNVRYLKKKLSVQPSRVLFENPYFPHPNFISHIWGYQTHSIDLTKVCNFV